MYRRLHTKYDSIIDGAILLVLLYLFIFSPSFVFLPFAGSRLVILFALLYITFKRSWGLLFGVYKVEFIIFIVFFIHSLFFKVVYGEARFINRYMLIFIELFVCSFALNIYSIKNNLNINNYAVFACSIAVLFSCLAFFFPVIHDFFYSVLKINNTSYENFEDRGYGFANDLLFTYSIAIAVGACLLLNKSTFNKAYLLLLPFFLLTIAINARVSLVVILSFLLVKNISYFSLKLVLNAMKFILISILLIYTLYSNDILVQQLDFVGLMFGWTYNLISGEGAVGHFALIFGDFLFWPGDWCSVVFGTGTDVFKAEYPRSDVGYVIQINYGGLFYFLLVFMLFSSLCLKNVIHYKKKSTERLICYTFILSGILINIKGYFYSYNPALSIFSLLMCHYYLMRPREINVKYLVNKNEGK